MTDSSLFVLASTFRVDNPQFSFLPLSRCVSLSVSASEAPTTHLSFALRRRPRRALLLPTHRHRRVESIDPANLHFSVYQKMNLSLGPRRFFLSVERHLSASRLPLKISFTLLLLDAASRHAKKTSCAFHDVVHNATRNITSGEADGSNIELIKLVQASQLGFFIKINPINISRSFRQYVTVCHI